MSKQYGVRFIISAIACFVFSGVFMLMIPEKTDAVLVLSTENESVSTQIVEEKAEAEEAQDEIVCEDSTVAVTYHGLTDVVGNIGMEFTIENKGDHEITVLPMDSSINDTMVLFVSGTPATVRPGKKFTQVWAANPETVGVSGVEDVKEIAFSLNYDDVTTELIEINLT